MFMMEKPFFCCHIRKPLALSKYRHELRKKKMKNVSCQVANSQAPVTLRPSFRGPLLGWRFVLRTQYSAAMIGLIFTKGHAVNRHTNMIPNQVRGITAGFLGYGAVSLFHVAGDVALDDIGAFEKDGHLVQRSGVVECRFVHERAP